MSLKYVLLSQLACEELSGYDLVKSFENTAGHFWSATHQQVYKELKGLHAKGLIDLRVLPQDTKPDKKLYLATTKGVDELRAWVETPMPKLAVRDPLLVKLHATRAVGCLGIIVQLERSRKDTQALLKTYRGIESAYFKPAPEKHAPLNMRVLYVALRKGIMSAESHLCWLDLAVSMFDQQTDSLDTHFE